MKSLLFSATTKNLLRPYRKYYDKIARPAYDDPAVCEAKIRELISEMSANAIFMFSFGRSGTTVFADFLSTHPNIVSAGEVLNERAFFSYYNSNSLFWRRKPTGTMLGFYEYLASLSKKLSPKKFLIDLKIESLHLIEGNWRLPDYNFKIFDYFSQSSVPVIFIERKDAFSRYISGQVAAANGQFHSFDSRSDTIVEKVHIDIDDMLENVSTIVQYSDFIKDKFQDYPSFLQLQYESLFEPTEDPNHSSEFSKVIRKDLCELLSEHDNFDPLPNLKKMTDTNYQDRIENWEEVKKATQSS